MGLAPVVIMYTICILCNIKVFLIYILYFLLSIDLSIKLVLGGYMLASPQSQFCSLYMISILSNNPKYR